jgi:hypothetical protein
MPKQHSSVRGIGKRSGETFFDDTLKKAACQTEQIKDSLRLKEKA